MVFVDGVYYCNMERTKELSDRMYDRNIPSQSLEPNIPCVQFKLALHGWQY